MAQPKYKLYIRGGQSELDKHQKIYDNSADCNFNFKLFTWTAGGGMVYQLFETRFFASVGLELSGKKIQRQYEQPIFDDEHIQIIGHSTKNEYYNFYSLNVPLTINLAITKGFSVKSGILYSLYLNNPEPMYGSETINHSALSWILGADYTLLEHYKVGVYYQRDLSYFMEYREAFTSGDYRAKWRFRTMEISLGYVF